jgi:nucleoside phosphorylase
VKAELRLAPKIGPGPAVLPTSDQALRQILSLLRNVEPFNRSSRRYFRGDVAPGASVVVSPVPRFGNIGAAAATTALLLDHDVSQLVVVGTCGGLAPHQQALADVVVATDVIYYEPGVIGGDAPAPRMRVSGSMPPSLRKRVEALALDYAQADIGPRVHLGSIASGEKVIKSAEDFAELMASWRSVVAVDMESAGVFEAAASLGQDVPIAVVRGIADFADARKNDEHRDDAATNAVKLALDLISRSLKDVPP